MEDGKAYEATFYLPSSIALDSANNIFVSDTYNNLIRKIDIQGNVTTVAGNGKKGDQDGQGRLASFFHPWGIAVGKSGSLYIADTRNHKIRKITPDGMVITLAGNGVRGAANGPGDEASFNMPYGLAVDKHENIYVADYQNNLITKIIQ